MSDFDDDLRRLLGDERLALTPRSDAAQRIVRGARRRRTVRVVASAAGSVGLVAAVAIGSMAAVGQFSAGPDLDPAPAETPTDLLPGPRLTDDPAPTTPVLPDDSVSTPGGDGTEPASEGEGDPGSGVIVLDPDVGIDGFTVGTPLTELQGIDGVELTPYGPENGMSAMCYGTYRSTWAHGMVSVPDSLGRVPADPTPYFEVSTMRLDRPFVTPEGIGIGSTEADVRAAYPSATSGADGDLSAGLDDETGRSWIFTLTDGLVSEAMLDGAGQCEVPADGEEPGVEPTGDPDDFAPGGFRVHGDEAFAPVRLGMTVADLRQLDGVRITESVPADQEYCYGTFEYGEMFGMISVRREFGSEAPPQPADSEDDYRVTYLSTTAPDATTPEGIGPGTPLDEVRQAYPDLAEGETFEPRRSDPGNPAVVWVFETSGADAVARLALDAGQNCAG